ncbi:uncharacterized protein LOC119078205 [Bradysia coprophila]|uniref:uncharacterized protein LOC119078205 n=1 Tax=Bradysia coprophila TaxID=38358 RepID=UPI00187D7398|nr:uncharacterized protein LOC119078205 [Bradysia coprophila]
MRILFSAAIILLAQIELISSQNEGCWMFDFSDPSLFNGFTKCYDNDLDPWALRMYNESTEPSSIRPTSTYYLTPKYDTDAVANRCSASRPFTLPASKTLNLEMALNIGLNISMFVTRDIWRFDLYSVPLNQSYTIYAQHWWESAAKTYLVTSFSVPDWIGEAVLQIYAKPLLSNAPYAAFEYIKIYDYPVSDGSCVDNYHTPEAPETPEENLCATIDFNQQSSSQILNDFQSCEDLQLPPLTIKSYENSTISPYRASSTFHLSSQTEGMSCLQLSKPLALDSNSRIRSAIYLNTLWPGAWVEIYVYDKLTGDRQVILSVESSGHEWRSLTGSVNRKFDHAQIFIQTNAAVHNGLAIEFLDITRTNNKCATQ